MAGIIVLLTRHVGFMFGSLSELRAPWILTVLHRRTVRGARVSLCSSRARKDRKMRKMLQNESGTARSVLLREQGF